MSELDALLDAEAEHTEQHRDAPAKPDTKVSRPGHGRSEVFSVRLNADEVAALEAAAEDAGLPSSTLARSWILERIRYESSPADRDLRKLVHDEVDKALRQRNEQLRAALDEEMRRIGVPYEEDKRLRRIIALLSAIPLPFDVPEQARSAPALSKSEEAKRA
jgi:uncharacterized membrane protein YccC